jgi:zinc transport system permease protein
MTMTELVAALLDPDLPFLRYALFTGLAASIAFGVIGSFVVVRRISYIAGAISHCVLGGIGAGLYLQNVGGISWFTPVTGALVAALLAAVLLTVISLRSREREDSVISAVWAGGMAVGLLFIARTPGYFDPMSYLFGNILLITRNDLYLVLGLDAVILLIVGLLYNKFLALCFDEEFARLRGLHTHWLYLLLLCLIAVTVVLLVRVVGIIMVIALLTLPAAVAGSFARSIISMMVFATLICALCVCAGLAISYQFDLPTGSTIILFVAGLYICVFGSSGLKKSIRKPS